MTRNEQTTRLSHPKTIKSGNKMFLDNFEMYNIDLRQITVRYRRSILTALLLFSGFSLSTFLIFYWRQMWNAFCGFWWRRSVNVAKCTELKMVVRSCLKLHSFRVNRFIWAETQSSLVVVNMPGKLLFGRL